MNPYAAPPEPADLSPGRRPATRHLTRLFVLFGTLYFVQGVIEPTASLPFQPLDSQLTRWGYSTGEVGRFFGIIGIAWSIKPLFGLISDFFPLAGRRRRPYLLLSTLLAAAAFAVVARLWSPAIGGGRIDDWGRWLVTAGPLGRAGWLLIIAGIGIAMSDVVIDALAVEEGQPRGITGQIQSVQWGAMSIGGVLAAVLGGYVAQHGWIQPMFLGCGLLSLVSAATVFLFVQEVRQPRAPVAGLGAALRELGNVRTLGTLFSVGLFLFCWNFNPFFSNVLNKYMMKELHLSQVYFGYMAGLIALAQAAACVLYFRFCRSISRGTLVHGSIAAGVASILVYWLLHDAWSAVLASILFGLANQTAILMQLDLAARVCPVSSAGTMFALLMAISNTGNTMGIHFGGQWYDQLTAQLGSPHAAFDALVLIGAAFTAACWLLVPLMKWTTADWQ